MPEQVAEVATGQQRKHAGAETRAQVDALHALAVSESMLLADAAGLDLETTLAAVENGAAGSWMLSNRGPQLINRDWAPGFTIDLQQKDNRIVLETDRGAITIEMLPEQAPLTVQMVARLAGEGRYDGVPFHRVLPNFMAQGGDVARGDGLGDPGFRIPSELTHLRYERGTVGMARAEKDTEGAQFFLALSIQPHLDGAYSAFGRVTITRQNGARSVP